MQCTQCARPCACVYDSRDAVRACLVAAFSRRLVCRMLSTAHLAESAPAFEEVVADFVDLFHFLWHVTYVLTTAVVTVSAPSFEVVVAGLVELLGWSVSDSRLSLLLLLFAIATLSATTTFCSWLSRFLYESSAIIIFAVQKSATITVTALAGLLPVEALTTWWRLDGVTFGVLVVALVTVSAPSCVSECPAHFLYFTLRDRKSVV